MSLDLLSITLIIIATFLSIMICYLAYSLSQLRKHRLQLKNENQLLHDGQDQLNLAFLELRGQRHDMLKHITAMHYLLEQGKYAEAKSYMNHLAALYDATNLTIKGEHGHLAAFLFHAKLMAEEHGLELQLDLDAPLTRLPLNMTDQSTLVGNLIINSLEAAIDYTKQHHAQQTSFVRIFTSIKSGLYILEISNSTLPLDRDIVDVLFKEAGHTSKKGQHEGLGTYLIAQMTKKYHGTLDYRYLNHTFTVKIKIPFLQMLD